MEYHVTWEIDLDADSPMEAAERALEIQRDPESIATRFEVEDENGVRTEVDLWDDYERMISTRGKRRDKK